MTQQFLKEAVIVAYGRSGVARAFKGSLKNTHPVDYAAKVLQGVLKKVPELDLKEIDDVIIGCAKPEGVQGSNTARVIVQRAGLPDEVPAQTINRFCSSGLQSIATAANSIMTGQSQVIIAGGVETMTAIPMASDPIYKNKWMLENNPGVYTPMGITAENVAEKYDIKKSVNEFSASGTVTLKQKYPQYPSNT